MKAAGTTTETIDPRSRVLLQLAGAQEVFRAPPGYSEEEAVRWIAHGYHPTADRRVRRISAGVYSCTNGRRGPRRRGTIVTVVGVEVAS